MLDRKHSVFLGGALGTLIILIVSLITTRESKIDLENDAKTKTILKDLAVAVEASPVPERNSVIPSQNQDGNVEIHASGAIINSDGVLRFPAENDAGIQSVRVINGRCFIDEKAWSFLQTSGLPTWFLGDTGFPCKVIESTAPIENAEEKTLVLAIGKGREVRVAVTDLRGDPIPFAKLQVYGASNPIKPQQQCDAQGIWNGTIFGKGNIKLIARADGFGKRAETLSLEEFGPTAIALQLGRFLAIGWIIDRREDSGIHSRGVNIGKYSVRPNTPDYRDRLNDIEEALDFDEENEYISWTIIYENEWIEGHYLLTRRDPKGALPREPIQVQLKHILDPTLVPYRFQEPRPKVFLPVDVQFKPSGNFLNSETPKTLVLHWEGKGEGSPSHSFLGTRSNTEGKAYRFFVPEGVYDISTSKDPLDIDFGKTPFIDPVFDFQAIGGVIPALSLEVTLAEGCFYSGYVLEDESGLQLEMAGILVEIHGESETQGAFMSSMFSWPQYRFFSGVQCQLWLSRYGKWPDRMGSPFTVEMPNQGELIHIQVPSAGLDKTLSQQLEQ